MPGKPISKSKQKGLAALAKKKPELAKKFGYNPTIWDENVELMIKLLSDPNYYRKTPVKYGAYRGPAKTYVKSIYSRYMLWRENE